MWSTDDTIAAIASPPAPGLRGIVRLSGPAVRDTLAKVFSSHDNWAAATRAARWEGAIDLGDPLREVPCELIYWPDGRSYTRQAAAELHLPGSLPIVEASLQRVCEHGARLAEPGEFTLRAYLAGRLDLTQAEAVLGVIDAQSKDELTTALRQLSGNLAKPLADARAKLLAALSHLEAGLDFADEDIEFISQEELRLSLSAALDSVDATIAQVEGRGQSDDLPRVVIYGRPNAGKSSLFKSLCGAQAIVSSTAGTTRDYLTAATSVNNIPCELVDTAGLDPQLQHDVDQQSQSLGQQQTDQARVRILCIDLTEPRSDWEQAELRRSDPQRIVVGAKCDLTSADRPSACPPFDCLPCSSRSGVGIDALKAKIETKLSAGAGDVVSVTAVRSHSSLRRTREALLLAIELVDCGEGEELIAIELRTALDCLGEVAGRLHYEEVLDQVFRQFCIGK